MIKHEFAVSVCKMEILLVGLSHTPVSSLVIVPNTPSTTSSVDDNVVLHRTLVVHPITQCLCLPVQVITLTCAVTRTIIPQKPGLWRAK